MHAGAKAEEKTAGRASQGFECAKTGARALLPCPVSSINRYYSKVTINPSIKMAIRGFIDEKGDFVGICTDGVAKFS